MMNWVGTSVVSTFFASLERCSSNDCPLIFTTSISFMSHEDDVNGNKNLLV
ncbi:hypothetical protein MKX01_031422 [Papaver californicum]|nr:hypothetical protein MKX01_031422 [Papaver californicum]